MHATLGSSSSLPLAQIVATKNDVASQTDSHHPVSMHTGRAVNCILPCQSVCPDICTENTITSTGKSLYDYGVEFVKGTLQGSSKLIRNVAGFTSQHVPDITQGLMFLAAMPGAGAHPVSTSPAYNGGISVAGTPYTPSLAYPTTNLTDPTSLTDAEASALVFGIYGGSFAAGIVLLCGYMYCKGVYGSCKQLQHDNPRALNRHVLRAALKDPWYGEGAENRQRCDRLKLPLPPPTTREIGTQTKCKCERGTQTEPEPLIDASVSQEQQPPTYSQATAYDYP